MSKLSKLRQFIFTKPTEILAYIFMKTAFFLPDDIYLTVLFRLKMNYPLNLKNPKSFNQKLQWLKIHDRKPEYSRMVDKYEAKILAANILSEDYIIPTLGIWNNFDDIDFSKLPNQFVLKKTDGCGNREVLICKDKNAFDFDKSRTILGGTLKRSKVYQNFREWPYKDIKPRILAEKYMVDESGTQLKDYKFYCFNGIPKMCLIANDRNSSMGPFFDFFDMDFNHLPFEQGAHNAPYPIEKPAGYSDMMDIAKTLSKGLTHVRIDLYNINGHIYFGEWTFFDSSGFDKFHPIDWDFKIGEWMLLPDKN